MKTIGNILWFLLSGVELAIGWFFLGLIWCVTIIGIPFGKQCFKIARLAMWPMGATVNSNFGAHPIANIIWFIFGGFTLCNNLLYLFALSATQKYRFSSI